MEPENDPELGSLLKEWQAPAAPASLEERVLGHRQSWWRFLLLGSIRVPVPLACCLALLLIAAAWRVAVPVPAGTCAVENKDLRHPPVRSNTLRPASATCLADSSC